MRSLPILVLAFLVVVTALLPTDTAAGTADAQDVQETEQAPRVIRLEAHNVGDEYWFKVVGKKTENPELGFLAGEQVEIHLSNTAHVRHNLRIGDPITKGLPLLDPGEEDVLRFTVPDDVDEATQYWCEPHRELGMFGKASFGEQKAGPDVEIPAPRPAVLLTLLVAMLTVLRPPWRPDARR